MKKYIVWVDNGGEGYMYDDYDTLAEAVAHESYGRDKIITKRVDFEVKEKE